MIKFPKISVERIAVKLKPTAEKMVKKGHPWVFENSIVKQNKKGKTGDIVIVYDSKKNSVLAIGLYDPHSPIRIKLIHHKKPALINENWFLNTIKIAYDKRLPLLKTDTDSYRLLFGENDQMPGFIADVYQNAVVIKLYSAIWFPYLSMIIPQLIKVTNCEVIVMRLSRSLQSFAEFKGFSDGIVIFGTLTKEEVVFKEHGVLFSANLLKGHKTGYFLDHRHNRSIVGTLSAGKKVLDVFSYAGGFSVHALVGGAKEVLSLDISKHALDLAKKNVALNPHSGNHHTLIADAFEGMIGLQKEGQVFDVVVIDPPSFAKQEKEVERAKRSYEKLVVLGVGLVAANGILVMASCSSRITEEEFFSIVERQLLLSQRAFQNLQKTAHDIDHPINFTEGAYLKCGYYRLV